ncbi:MAG: response regulator, partial [Bacillota bacterium]
ILKNLLSNAFKFTGRGRVAMRIGMAQGGWSADNPNFAQADGVLAFSVTDTGVGIAADKLQLIFEAFQQADGSTARKYGGTGLGLSISRELARLLGGEIRVESVIGAGSTFTLYLPYLSVAFMNYGMPPAPFHVQQQAGSQTGPAQADGSMALAGAGEGDMMAQPVLDVARPAVSMPGMDTPFVEFESALDDRTLIAPGDPAMLIVEDDAGFANVLLDYAREKNFKGIVTHQGASVLTLARDYLPVAILLDIDLPDMGGFAMLDRLKRDPATRHIPVHVMGRTLVRERALQRGAISCLHKPVDRERLQEEFARIQQFLSRGKRNLLIVEDDALQRESMIDLIDASDVNIVAVGTGQEALSELASQPFDCMVVDLSLPDMSGFELLDMIGEDDALRDLPIVVYTAKDLNRKEVARLKRIAKTVVVKDVRSSERLLDETALFLHRSPASLPEVQRRMLEDIRVSDSGLAGRKVLIVDDDLRNIFALSSVLERQQMKVLFAENGRDGIEVLQREPDVEIVLMDIMMPEMDGYDTMRAIRSIPRFKALPIITLTAKAMKGDRDKCLAAGASDYITKPVDVAQLLSLMRVWLHGQG